MDRPNRHRARASRRPDDALLTLVHAPSYIDAVKEAGSTGRPDPLHGLGTMDNPVFADMHDASALVAGGTLAAARAVLEETHDHAVNVAGGLHHAMPAAASGSASTTTPPSRSRGCSSRASRQIAYVDIDAHHGDGVQAAFWDDPRVLTISLHESGRTLFPGTGFPDEIGGAGAPRAPRSTSRCRPAPATPAGCARSMPSCRHWCARSRRRSSSRNTDATATRSIRWPTCSCSLDGQRTAHAAMHGLAHEVCDGRWIATGGGGYELVRVVPRSWTHLLAEASGEPIDARDRHPGGVAGASCSNAPRRTAPLRMTDGRMPVFDAVRRRRAGGPGGRRRSRATRRERLPGDTG